MKKLQAICLSTFATLAFAVPAWAGNPHFIKNATDVWITGNYFGATLHVEFKEAGLESGAVETVRVSAWAQTTYECVNGGEKNPSASNKTTTKSQVSNSASFTADQNGNIEGTVHLNAPSAASLGFSCPPGQTTTFVSVYFTSIYLQDLTSGAWLNIPGTYWFVNTAAP